MACLEINIHACSERYIFFSENKFCCIIFSGFFLDNEVLIDASNMIFYHFCQLLKLCLQCIFCFRLFADEINWGRVAALMCLAYRITMTVVKEKAKKFAQFMKVIVSHVVRFIKEKIAGWIASQGGWVSYKEICRYL